MLDSVTRSIDFLNKHNRGDSNLDVEQIIVDDGSKDSTVKIVEDYASTHSHVRFFAFTQNRGTNAARNKAISEAKGEWITLLDSDDYYTEDALYVIAKTLRQKSDYKHYMFGRTDVELYYKENAVIKGAPYKVLTYSDFLNGYVSCDFVHVCSSDIMHRHLFDESIRIYEGIWFMMFYRDAKRMLFTNKIIDVVEQNRSDSVSYEFLRITKPSIERACKGGELFLDTFGDDMRNMGMKRKLYSQQVVFLENYTLLGNYVDANNLIIKMEQPHNRKDRVLRKVIHLHFSFLYSCIRKTYLILKYKVLKQGLRRF